MANPVVFSMYADSKTALVKGVANGIVSHYVFPDIAERVARDLQTRLDAGDYFAIHDPVALGEKITADILAIANDKHIRLRFSASATSPPGPQGASGQAEAEYRARCLDCNFGVERVERLPINIGYVELRGFMRTDLAGEAIAAAMTLIANTDALIFDLRRNGGGYPETVALVSSYLLDEPRHLNSFYLREGDKTRQFWTQPWVPGRKYGETKPVFVLISPATFSAAEEFAYNLQCLKRATIFGESSRGGAHPGEFHWITPHYSLCIPGGRAINPITHSNWEGCGVEPDARVPHADALRTAQLLALEQMGAQQKNPLRQAEIEERIRALQGDAQ